MSICLFLDAKKTVSFFDRHSLSMPCVIMAVSAKPILTCMQGEKDDEKAMETSCCSSNSRSDSVQFRRCSKSARLRTPCNGRNLYHEIFSDVPNDDGTRAGRSSYGNLLGYNYPAGRLRDMSNLGIMAGNIQGNFNTKQGTNACGTGVDTV